MRILTENEKRYESIMMLEEASKKDIKSIKNHYKFKYKVDYFTPMSCLAFVVLLIVGIVFFVMGSVAGGVVCIVLSILSCCCSVFLYLLNKKKYWNAFQAFYADAIEKNGKIKYDGYKVVSKLFPLYINCDKELKAITFNYQDKNAIFCEYDDILNFSVYYDDKETENAKLDEAFEAEEYHVLITFNNKKTAKIQFSNTLKNFDKNYLKEENKNSINNIVNILNAIIMKNEVK